MTEEPLELHQFTRSHFNEKVRWTLDYKGIPHLRISYLPGPHMPQIQRMSGQPQVPVLRIEGRAVHGSSAIIDLIEQRYPEPPLYPADETEREEALSIQSKLDAELGPEVRRALFAEIMDDGPYMMSLFASDKPAWKQRLYAAAFPGIRPVMKKSMNITPETGRRARERVAVLLDWIGERCGSGYLVGDSFTVADLTAAALLGPVLTVNHPDMSPPGPRAPRHQALCDEWASHPAIVWAHEIWARHRPARGGILAA